MTFSSLYHQFNALSKKYNDCLLRIDLIGIGVMIFTLTLTLSYAGFHANPSARGNIMLVMLMICIFNFLIQMTPCYAQDSFDNIRTAFYVIILFVCIGLAIAWYLYFATEYEIENYALRIASAFIYLGIGFGFF
jgi:predicted membrane channel-forming protein YqfA (hemolysin III family)